MGVAEDKYWKLHLETMNMLEVWHLRRIMFFGYDKPHPLEEAYKKYSVYKLGSHIKQWSKDE